MICNERQVKEAEGEKVRFILCWMAEENIIIEELAENGNEIRSIQKSSCLCPFNNWDGLQLILPQN